MTHLGTIEATVAIETRPLAVRERIEQAWAEIDRIMTERMGEDWREQKYVRM